MKANISRTKNTSKAGPSFFIIYFALALSIITINSNQNPQASPILRSTNQKETISLHAEIASGNSELRQSAPASLPPAPAAPLPDSLNVQIDESIGNSNQQSQSQSQQGFQQQQAFQQQKAEQAAQLSALKRNLKKLLAIHNKGAGGKGDKPASIDQIHISAEALENLSMDDVVKIAEKTSAGSKSKLKPIDKVVLFLQQEQKLIQAEKEKKRQEALEEVLKEQTEREVKDRAERRDKEAKRKEEIRKEEEKELQAQIQKEKAEKQVPKLQKDLSLLQIHESVSEQSSAYVENLKKEILEQQQQLLQTRQMLQQAQLSSGSGNQQAQSLGASVNLAALQHLKDDLKTQITTEQGVNGAKELVQTSADVKKTDRNGNKIEDNLSLSEIIAQRYKKQIKVQQVKSPEEAAQLLIKDTKQFDVNDSSYTEGSVDLQQKYQEELGPIETNLAQKWKDLSDVKQRLWQKLHAVKDDVKKGINNQLNNLAQVVKKKKQVQQKQITKQTPKMVKPKPQIDNSLAQTSRLHINTSSQNSTSFSIEYAVDLVQRKLELYEMDTGVLVALVVVSALLLCCIVLICCTCCLVSGAAQKAQKEQEKAYADLVEEVKKEKEAEKTKGAGEDDAKEAENKE